MLSSDSEFSGNVGRRQIILVKCDNLFAVLVVDSRVSCAVKNVDFVAGHIGRVIDGPLLSVAVGACNQRRDGRQERRAHAIQGTGQRSLGTATRYLNPMKIRSSFRRVCCSSTYFLQKCRRH